MKTQMARVSALLLAAASIPAVVDAATIETFTFMQTGYPLTDMASAPQPLSDSADSAAILLA